MQLKGSKDTDKRKASSVVLMVNVVRMLYDKSGVFEFIDIVIGVPHLKRMETTAPAPYPAPYHCLIASRASKKVISINFYSVVWAQHYNNGNTNIYEGFWFVESN